MADRTFESQQYASQEARAGEASLSQGVSALAGAATQAGAALERHGDRMAQREQAGAQMAESRRQADQSAGLRREEMGIQREQLDQQGRQFEMTRSHQMADLQFRQQVDARVAANQAAEQEVRNLGVQLQWQDSTAARAEAAARWEQEERKLAVLSNTKITAAQLKAQEIQNDMAETQLKAIKEQQAGEYQRGRLRGQTLEQMERQAASLGTFLEKLTGPDSMGAGPERATLVESVKARYEALNKQISDFIGESDAMSRDPSVGPPPPRRPVANPVVTPPPIGGVREINYSRFDDIVTRTMIGAVRSPRNADPANKNVFGMILREKEGGGGTEYVDQVAFQKWKQAASRLFVGMPEQGHDESAFTAAFNRQVEALMNDHGMSLHAALDYLGGSQ